MDSNAPKYIDWFVNREKQRKGFLMMLQGKTPKQIMAVKAGTLMGKTWLIQNMYHNCRSRDVPVTVLDFSRRLPWDLLTIVRTMRDDYGTAHFNHLTNVINQATQLRVGNMEVNVTIADSQISDSDITVGGEMQMAADNLGSVRADSDIVRRNLELRITEAFITCLQALSQGQKAVILCDSLELAPRAAQKWLVNHLLWAIREGKLTEVVVIMAGREVPQLDTSWNEYTAKTGLDKFSKEHVAEFIIKTGIQEHLDISADDLMALSLGHPGTLGNMADNVVLKQLEQEVWI